MHKLVIPVLATVIIAACDRDHGPAITVDDVRIIAPLPGSTTGVAYLTVANHSDDAITINEVRSPQFGSVEMHETQLDDGVSRMRMLSEVTIGSGESVRFAEGGKHLMLQEAAPGTGPGVPVTLEISHDEGLIIVSAVMQARLPGE